MADVAMKGGVTQLLASGLSALLWLLARLPGFAQRGVTSAIAFLYGRLARESHRTIVTNVNHLKEGLEAQGVSIADPNHFARSNLAATAQLLVETAVCWRGEPQDWRSLVGRVHDEDVVALLTEVSRHQEPGRGVLLLSPHLGNWELLNMYLGAEFGVTALYDPPKIAALDPLIRRARERTRSTLLPIGPAGLRGMVRRLRSGGVVGLLPDQVPAIENGVVAPFFGKQALTINLVHRLTSRHRPRVFLVCALRNASGLYDIHFDELTEALSDVSQEQSAMAMNSAIERRVAQAPEQYQWSYKRFKRAVAGQPNIYRPNRSAPPEGRR